ncbi:MAG: hypothetical protein ACIAXF_12065 [Phycisphaerales bacterium JB063]
MLDTFKTLLADQYDAVFCMLGACIDRCPDESWDAPVANLRFCQVVFHTLFFTDVYLGENLVELRGQDFHQEHAEAFADYEELEHKVQEAMYTRPFIRAYLTHCREKMARVIDGETEASLKKLPGFDWLEFSRAEVHVYNIRHIHHHAAQLGLRLRLDHAVEIPWCGSKWRDLASK